MGLSFTYTHPHREREQRREMFAFKYPNMHKRFAFENTNNCISRSLRHLQIMFEVSNAVLVSYFRL